MGVIPGIVCELENWEASLVDSPADSRIFRKLRSFTNSWWMA